MVKPVFWWVSGKEIIITKGHYDGTSKGMESYSFRSAMETLA
jgi:hypothetical protein